MLTSCNSNDSQETVSNNLIVTSSHGIDGAAYGLADCGACHAINVIHEGLNIHDIVANKGFVTCIGCHGDNGTGESRPCTVCHNPTDLPLHPQQSGHLTHNFNTDSIDKDCVTCHFSSDMNGNFVPNIDLTSYPNVNGQQQINNSISEFCLSCHNRDNPQTGFEITNQDYNHPLIAMQDNYNFVDKHGWTNGIGTRTYNGLRPNYQYFSLVECTDCHAMHGTNNESLIIDSASKGTSKLPTDSEDYSVTITGGNSAQLCVLCHQMQDIVEQGDKNTGNGLTGVHAVSGDCSTCHSHGETVQAGL
ncbi:cytochrome c3 family protein [Thiotrichales bacterium HSG1]|nr:cytochrome c3 family protein [Thiotrichales bacterium HSG1]